MPTSLSILASSAVSNDDPALSSVPATTTATAAVSEMQPPLPSRFVSPCVVGELSTNPRFVPVHVPIAPHPGTTMTLKAEQSLHQHSSLSTQPSYPHTDSGQYRSLSSGPPTPPR